MRYIYLAIVITGSAALFGCSGGNNNSDTTGPPDSGVPPGSGGSADQANAKLAVSRVDTVINTSKDVNLDEPQNIDRIILPAANTAEPVAVTGANASL